MKYFCLDDYDCVALDMDHTVVQYNLSELSKLIYKSIVDYLVQEKGYETSVLNMDNYEQFEDLSQKGLIFDYTKGNMLKLAKNGYILSCSHGFVQLSNIEIEKEYGMNRLWPKFAIFQDKISISAGYVFLENFYVMPTIPIISILVDNADFKNNGRLKGYSFIWKDIRSALDLNFNYKSFKENKGLFMPSLKTNPEKYVKRCPQSVVNWFKKLQKNKVVVLITQSFGDLTEHLMKFTIGTDWKNKFDFIVAHAKKPNFFHADCEDRPFYTMDDNEEISEEEATELHPHVLYLCGSSKRLENGIQKYLCKDSPPKFVYFGDSIKSDIYSPAVHTNWHTVAILEEMEAEETLYYLNNTSECEPKRKKMKLALKKDKLIIASNRWGSFFTHPVVHFSCNVNVNEEKMDKTLNKINTFWADIIQRYSKLAIPLLDYIADLPVDHKFQSFADDQLGFYPHPPQAIGEKEECVE